MRFCIPVLRIYLISIRSTRQKKTQKIIYKNIIHYVWHALSQITIILNLNVQNTQNINNSTLCKEKT